MEREFNPTKLPAFIPQKGKKTKAEIDQLVKQLAKKDKALAKGNKQKKQINGILKLLRESEKEKKKIEKAKNAMVADLKAISDDAESILDVDDGYSSDASNAEYSDTDFQKESPGDFLDKKLKELRKAGKVEIVEQLALEELASPTGLILSKTDFFKALKEARPIIKVEEKKQTKAKVTRKRKPNVNKLNKGIENVYAHIDTLGDKKFKKIEENLKEQADKLSEQQKRQVFSNIGMVIKDRQDHQKEIQMLKEQAGEAINSDLLRFALEMDKKYQPAMQRVPMPPKQIVTPKKLTDTQKDLIKQLEKFGVVVPKDKSVNNLRKLLKQIQVANKRRLESKLDELKRLNRQLYEANKYSKLPTIEKLIEEERMKKVKPTKVPKKKGPTNKELQDLLAQHGLSKTGKKEVLIARLEANGINWQ